MTVNKTSKSKASSYEAIGEFWDKHDFTEFDDANAPDVDFNVTIAVPIELDLLDAIEEQARLHGVSVETLVNLWLKEKLVTVKTG